MRDSDASHLESRLRQSLAKSQRVMHGLQQHQQPLSGVDSLLLGQSAAQQQQSGELMRKRLADSLSRRYQPY
jgi:hypothetical protein